MKKLLSFLVCLTLFASVQAQLRIVEVNPTTNEITIKNFGSADIDITTFRLCSLFDYEALNEAQISVVNGDLILSQDEEVDIIWASLSGMDELGSDLGLYLPTGSFADPVNMIDFVQWESAGNGRESVANAAGIWVTGTFISGLAPFSYTGNGTENGVGFWATYVAPTTTLVINEVDADQTGSDIGEFVELFGTANEPLDGMVLVFYNGSGDVSYGATDLDGHSLNSEGFFVIGDAGVTNVDLVLSGSIQNGADAVALYFGDDTDFPSNTPVTSSNIIDAFVYGTDDPDDAGLLTLLNPGQPQVNENSNAAGGTESNSRIPDGGTQLNTDTYVQQLPSPGCLNVTGCPVVLVPTASFAVSTQSVVEGEMVDVVVTMADSDAAYSVAVSVTGGTATAVDDYNNVFPTTLNFAMGDNTPQTVSFLIVDDIDMEVDETITLGLTTLDLGLTIDVDVQIITIEANDVPTLLLDIVDVISLDVDGAANSLGLNCELRGLVYGVNMRAGGMQFTLIDPTDGIGVYHATNDFGYTVNEGDSVHVTGIIGQFNGLTQLDLNSITLISSGNMINDPIPVTALDEFSESNLVSLTCLSVVDPLEWTNTGSGFNVDVTDGTNTYSMRIDDDVDVYGTDAPVGAFDLIGIGGQFDPVSPYDAGYQIFPRSLADITGSLVGDYNNDLAVNAADLLFLLAEFGCTSGCEANLVPGPNVDAADLLAFLASFGNSCY